MVLKLLLVQLWRISRTLLILKRRISSTMIVVLRTSRLELLVDFQSLISLKSFMRMILPQPLRKKERRRKKLVMRSLVLLGWILATKPSPRLKWRLQQKFQQSRAFQLRKQNRFLFTTIIDSPVVIELLYLLQKFVSSSSYLCCKQLSYF